MLKKILKYLGLTLLGIITLIACLYLFVSVDPHQRPEWASGQTVVEQYQQEDFTPSDIAALEATYAQNKEIPPAILLPTLLALKQYPELKDYHMVFHYAPAMIPMSSRPAPSGVLKHAKKRAYHVYISSESDPGLEPILIHRLPFNAQVAIMAHEIGHTLFYTKLTGIQVAKFGLQYLIDKEDRAAHEKGTDSLVVYKGLGEHLYEYADYVRSSEAMGDGYVEGEGFADEFYLRPGLIRELMNTLPY